MGKDEKARMDFIQQAINEHKGSEAYKMAVDAELYFKERIRPSIATRKLYTICRVMLIGICTQQTTRSQAAFLALMCGKRFPISWAMV